MTGSQTHTHCMSSGGQRRHPPPAFSVCLFFFFFSHFDFCKVLSMLVAFLGLSDGSSSHLTDTRTHTISVCLSVFSPQEVHCAEQSFVKTLSSFHPTLSSNTPPPTFIFRTKLSALWWSIAEHKDTKILSRRRMYGWETALLRHFTPVLGPHDVTEWKMQGSEFYWKSVHLIAAIS